jgi:hypothetical protein
MKIQAKTILLPAEEGEGRGNTFETAHCLGIRGLMLMKTSMNILNELIASLPEKETRVRGVCAGAFWTAVTTRHTGLATTYRDNDLRHDIHACPVKDAGSLRPGMVMKRRLDG